MDCLQKPLTRCLGVTILVAGLSLATHARGQELPPVNDNDQDAQISKDPDEDHRRPAVSSHEDHDEMSDEDLHALERALQADAPTDTERSSASDENDAPSDASQERSSFGRTMEAIGHALNPEISATLNLAAAYFSDTPMQMGHHDPHRNGFTFQELELAFLANVDPYFKFAGYLSASEHGIELEEAYAQTTSLPARFQVRAGKFLHRFGRINAQHAHRWDFLDMPLVIGRFFGEEGLNGTGLEVSWLAPTPWYAEIIFSAAHGADARSFRGEESAIDTMRDFVYLAALKNHFAFNDSWSLGWGVSGALGRNNAQWDPDILDVPLDDLPTHGLTQIYGTDLYLRFRPVDAPGYRAFSLTFEFMHRQRMVGGMQLNHSGLYAQAIGNLSQRWEVGTRYEWVSGSERDDLDPDWTRARHRMSAQGTFYPSHFSRIRLQGNYDHPLWRPQPIVSIMLGLEVSVGPHGAHTF